MSVAKIAISIDDRLLHKLDRYIQKKIFKNRSQAFQEAIYKTVSHLDHNRLREECTKLNIHEEQHMAEEGISEDFKEWPQY